MPYKTYQTGTPKRSSRNTADSEMMNTHGDMMLDAEMTDIGNSTNGEGEKKVTPTWLSKIKAGGVKKVPKEVQKRRRNYKLKKLLTPKAPIMILYELLGTNEVKFEPFEVDQTTRLLRVKATYSNKSFDGLGPNKSIAKNVCAESILQYIVIQACNKSANNKMEEDIAPVEVDNEDQGTRGGQSGVSHGEDETPWTALASLALFKLFSEWQSQGAQLPPDLMKGARTVGNQAAMPGMPAMGGIVGIPVMASTMSDHAVPVESKSSGKREKKEPKTKTLPENPTDRHPVQLLNEMNGQLEYDATVSGQSPNVLYTVTVTVNGLKHAGEAKNKKEAKKLAAQAALKTLYNVEYPA